MDSDRFTASLPLELRRVVIELLPKTTLKSVRLVNKQWSALAATVLWANVSIDLNEDNKRKIDHIVNSNPCGILDNLKELNISTALANLNTQKAQDATTNLLRLLGVLSRDSLVAFRCANFRLDQHTLGLLLRNQSHLTDLQFCVNEKKQAGLPGTNYVKGNLSRLQSITVRPVGGRHSTYKGLETWFFHLPMLRALAIEGMLPGARNDFAGWTLPVQTPLLRIVDLTLRGLRLLDTASRMDLLLDIPCLESLDIIACDNVEPLLRSFAKSFMQKGSALRAFLCIPRDLPEKVSKACEELFESVETLEKVVVGTCGECSLPRITSLHRNSQSLQTLCLHTARAGISYSLPELGDLAVHCPNLLQLWLSVGDLRDTIDDMILYEPFDITTVQDYAKSLDVIGRMPKLHTLNLIDHPLLSQGSNTEERRWRYAQVADQILGRLAQVGSKVKSLHFIPASEPDGVANVPDANGHRWPYYSYERGTLSRYDGEQFVRTVAIPIPSIDQAT